MGRGLEEKGGSSRPEDVVRVDSLKEYQSEIRTTFKTHPTLTPTQAEMLDWALGIGGEAGEVQEIVKHHLFSGEPLDLMKLAKELGDILWYVSALASVCNINMADVAGLNIHKLRHRYHDGGYNREHSANRHSREVEFTKTKVYESLRRNIEGV